MSRLGRTEALLCEWRLKAKLRPVPMSVSSSAAAQPNAILVKCYQVHGKAADARAAKLVLVSWGRRCWAVRRA